MSRSVAFLLAAATLTGCSSTPEQPVLNQFFTASRLHDNTTLAGFATVAFEPGVQGTVTTFDITGVTPEERRPLPLRALAKAHDDARAADAEFTKRKESYQVQNIDAIKRVIEAEREKRKLAPKDAEVQAAWSKFLEEGVAVSRKVGDARRKLASQSVVVDMSINGGPTRVDATKYDGDLITKDVSISAPVRLPSGQTARKNMIVTMQRAVLRGDKEITGRWIVTSIRDASGSASTPQS
jgi:hypothetical protein